MSHRDGAAGSTSPALNVESAVRERYTAAAAQAEPALCCPVDYDAGYLEIIPEEVLQRDYGCGDPSRHVGAGERVLDLGCGGGKICFICAQIVGPRGRVIGVDCNDEMLDLARRSRPVVARRLGYDNVEFRKGRIQDLGLDLDLLQEHLSSQPVCTSGGWLQAQEHAEHLRQTSPLVADESVDVVVSNCVLNLVRESDRGPLFAGVHRVLRPGGRAVISDIVCDRNVPPHLKADARLWSGCLSGAFREDRLLQAFEEAGFCGIEILDRQPQPWAVVEGIAFRSMTVRAYRRPQVPESDDHRPGGHQQSVIYNGPWKAVIDDEGRTLERGIPMALSDSSYAVYTHAPYAEQITPISPARPATEKTGPAKDSRGVGSPEPLPPAAMERMILPADGCCGGETCC